MVSEILANYSKVVLKIHNEVPKWLLKFCRNRSVSDGFRDINIFLFFRKNSRWPPKVAKIEIFQLHIEYSTTTMRVKIAVKMALSLTVSEILTFFVFP